MIFTDEEALERIKHPRNAASIELAKNQEDRLLFHCESIMEKYNLPWWASRNFTMWWQSLVTPEKHKKIEQLITTPLASTSLTDEIFDRLRKFLEAQDRYVSFEFTSTDYTNDFNNYLKSVNNDTFWKEVAFQNLSSGINSITVIDCPSKQKTERPEPYCYFVSPHFFVDIEINKFTGKIEYFIFRQHEFKWDETLNQSAITGVSRLIQPNTKMEKIIFIDDTSYRVCSKEAENNNAELFILSKSEHNLGYCPCIDFWKPSIGGSQGINKRGILSDLLSKLDMYLFYSALASYMDIYGAFPIFVTYSMEDKQWDEKNKQVNFGDYYSPQTTTIVGDASSTAQDPKTSYHFMGAPGTVMEYEAPASGDDANFVKDPPRFIVMPVESLKHVADRLKELKNEITQFATGENLDYLNEIAKNDEMLAASFDKQDSILTFAKRQMERVHQFSIKAMAELRYGKEYFLSATVDYGSEFFLKDAGKIVQEYDSAVKAGMSPEYCAQIAKQATFTRFKNNPEVLSRQRIIADVIPYKNYSNEDLITMGVNTGDVENFVIRLNADNFITQFELDFGDIVKFGSKLQYSDKIYFIKEQLKRYGTAIKWVSGVTNTGK